MGKLLFLIPDLNYSGTTKQVSLLGCALSDCGYEPTLCVIGRSRNGSERTCSARFPLECLDRTRLLDATAYLRLRRLVQSLQPDVIHVWGRDSLRMLWLATRWAGRSCSPHILASGVKPFRPLSALQNRIDRWLLRQADGVIATGPAEAEQYRRWGVPVHRIEQVVPGTALASGGREPLSGGREPPEAGSSGGSRPPLAGPAGRFLLCVGPLERSKGYRDAIWAFDILRYLYDDLRLVLVGDGPDRPRLEQFTRDIRATQRVHFVGPQPDVTPFLEQSAVVWVPGVRHGGVNVALEAMAAGKPVVAARLPELAEVVADGVTGFLVPPEGRVGFAKQTRRLLDDEPLQVRLGRAARRRVEESFAAAHLVGRMTRLYNLGRTRAVA